MASLVAEDPPPALEEPSSDEDEGDGVPELVEDVDTGDDDDMPPLAAAGSVEVNVGNVAQQDVLWHLHALLVDLYAGHAGALQARGCTQWLAWRSAPADSRTPVHVMTRARTQHPHRPRCNGGEG